MPQGPVKEPALRPADRPHATLVEDHAALFDGKPLGIEVEQQALGDCFFLATLASLAQRRPEAIEAAIHERAGGTFAVRFFHLDHATGTVAPREVVVDGRIPEEHEHPIYAKSAGGRGLWVSIFEKAFAALRGGFGALDRGGDPVAAIEALTGKLAHTTWLEPKMPDEIWDALHEAVAARQITLAATFTDDQARAMLAHKHAQGKPSLPPEERETFSHAQVGLVAAHEYSVWALSGPGEPRAVTLRNPWAYRAETSLRGDGIFSLPLHRFTLFFANVCVGG